MVKMKIPGEYKKRVVDAVKAGEPYPFEELAQDAREKGLGEQFVKALALSALERYLERAEGKTGGGGAIMIGPRMVSAADRTGMLDRAQYVIRTFGLSQRKYYERMRAVVMDAVPLLPNLEHQSNWYSWLLALERKYHPKGKEVDQVGEMLYEVLLERAIPWEREMSYVWVGHYKEAAELARSLGWPRDKVEKPIIAAYDAYIRIGEHDGSPLEFEWAREVVQKFMPHDSERIEKAKSGEIEAELKCARGFVQGGNSRGAVMDFGDALKLAKRYHREEKAAEIVEEAYAGVIEAASKELKREHSSDDLKSLLADLESFRSLIRRESKGRERVAKVSELMAAVKQRFDALEPSEEKAFREWAKKAKR